MEQPSEERRLKSMQVNRGSHFRENSYRSANEANF